MVKFFHHKTQYQIGIESTYGTEATTTTNVGTVRSIAPTRAWDVLEIQGVGDGREVQDYMRSRFNGGHEVVIEMHDFNILRHAVGPKAGAGTEGDRFTITEADFTGISASANITPFSAEIASVSSADNVDTYTGNIINDFTLTFALGQAVFGRFNVIGQSVTSSTTASSYTSLTSQPFIMNSGTFKWGATPSQVVGIRTLTITYDNRLFITGDWGTPLIVIPETGKRVISWVLTTVMTDSIATTLRDDFYGQANTPVTAPADMVFDANNEIEVDLDEGSATGNKDALIRLDHCIIESIAKPIDIGTEDLVLVTFTGRATTSKSDVFAEYWTN